MTAHDLIAIRLRYVKPLLVRISPLDTAMAFKRAQLKAEQGKSEAAKRRARYLCGCAEKRLSDDEAQIYVLWLTRIAQGKTS